MSNKPGCNAPLPVWKVLHKSRLLAPQKVVLQKTPFNLQVRLGQTDKRSHKISSPAAPFNGEGARVYLKGRLGRWSEGLCGYRPKIA